MGCKSRKCASLLKEKESDAGYVAPVVCRAAARSLCLRIVVCDSLVPKMLGSSNSVGACLTERIYGGPTPINRLGCEMLA
ncbi:hypothetical protein GWN65_07195 [Candidatus Bathyarchaeota archaeon]|nr:hypothetical protein [Candidatus Bathyarchaeota archaeon]